MKKQLIKVSNVRFNNGVVGTIRFAASTKGVVACLARGLPRIQIRETKPGWFEAKVQDTVLMARTPKNAFRKAVAAYWS